MSKILVIEDDHAIREIMSEALEIEGYTVDTAENGEVGLEKLRRDPLPRLILLDLMMPVMDGWQFMKLVRKDHNLNPIPIVLLSAFMERSHEIVCQGRVSKPIELDTLFDMVKHYCDQ